MLKKEITFEDFDGNEQTREFYFNLTAAELADFGLGPNGELLTDEIVKQLEGGNQRTILETFKDLIGRAVGLREGEIFLKSPEITQQFLQSTAFDSLFFELMSSEDAFPKFISAVAPKKLRETLLAGTGFEAKTTDVELPPTLDEKLDEPDPEPWIIEDREPTKKERQSMDRDQLLRALKAREIRKNREAENADLLSQFTD